MKKFLLFSVSVLLASVPLVRGQNLNVSTLAGNAGQISADGSATIAKFNNPWGMAIDATGNIFIADTDSHCIRKVTSAGAVSVFAGAIGVAGTNDATGTSARFNSPMGVTIDPTGNLYVTDTGNHTIRRISPLGAVTTVAGSPGTSGVVDGIASTARFNQPEGIVINAAGTLLYIADTLNHTIRTLTPGGTVTLFAGAPTSPGMVNATGVNALFNTPQGLAIDGSGNLYVADTGNQLIRMVTSGAVVSTFAGVSGTVGSSDGASGSAKFWDPTGVAVDSANNVYVADSFNNTIRKIASATVTTPVGSVGNMGSADGSSTTARFWQPQGLAVDASGNVYVADSGNGTIRKIVGTTVSTIAGAASIGSANATGATARFFSPSAVAIDSSGNAYVADTQNHTIRIVTSAGVASTLAGTAGVSGTSDGNGGSALFNSPQGIARDSSGNLYVADTANHAIRKVTSGGTVTLFAGTIGTSGSIDGTGAAAQFNNPHGVAVDGSGNVYVADTGNHTVRMITSGGVVTTLAGVAMNFGTSDGTGANVGTNGARFNGPSGVAVDGAGNVYVADTYNHTIRRISSTGVVSTLAGLGGSYGSTDGLNGAARFNLPEGVAVDASGNVFVLDSGNHTVRKVTALGTNWVVTTVAGTANTPGSADGVGNAARFFNPIGISVNAAGTVAIADLGNNTIRTAINAFGNPPTITAQPQSQTIKQGQTASFSVTATSTNAMSYQWYFNGGAIANATTSSYSKANAQAADAGSYSVNVSNAGGTTPSAAATLTVNVPAAITSNPTSQTVNAGNNASFSVTASGTAPLSYQWYFGASPISGATTSTLSVTNAQAANIGTYSVVVTNVAGNATSGNATLTVNPTAPSITAQPQSIAVNQSASATFSVSATGSTPLSYRWLLNGGVIGGATDSIYSIANTQSSNAGSYAVIVTNNYGAVTSSVATLTMVIAPVIATQPQSQMTWVGSNVVFNVTLSQGTNVFYQWQQNGTAIPGATLASYSISPVQWSSAGSYLVVVTNGAGSATSSTATLVVQQVPQTFFDGFETYGLGSVDNNTSGGPNANPATDPWWTLSTSVPKGGVTNSGTGVTPHSGSQMLGVVNTATTIVQDYYNLVYRLNSGSNYFGNFMCEWWFYDSYGQNPAGATNMQEYIALVQNTVSSTSDYTSLTMGTPTQRMSLGMFNGSAGYDYNYYQARIIGGSGGTFGAANSWYNTATPRSVGWHHARIIAGIPNATNSAPISMFIDNMTNATAFSPTVANVGFNLIELNHEMSKAGYYGYYDDLTFRAANDPWIVEQPKNATVSNGFSTMFTTVAIGSSYQWQLNNSPIAGATSTSYSIAAVAPADGGTYTCLVTGTNGTISTAGATLNVVAPPIIQSQPTSQTINAGQNATFSVSATGNTPFTYQWLFNNTPINGATSSSYTVTNATASNAGSYKVTVNNVSGTATSATATLTVNVIAPVITTQPSSLTVFNGANAKFTVSATGTALTYQWRYNGASIANATDSSYLKQNVKAADAGSYSVVVGNSAGSATSSNAALTVAASQTMLASITANADNSVTTTWQVSPGSNYTLQYKDSLLDAQWNNLATTNASSGTITVSNTAVTNSARSYQLASGQAASEVGGLLRMPLLGSSDSFVSIPFGRAPALTFLVGSVSGNLITVSSSPGWAANQFVYASGTQSNTYFVRFTSGAAAGRSYTVTANGANTLTVNLGNDSLASVAQNDMFSLEPYWTLNTVFPNGAGVNASPTVGNRNTEILTPDFTGAGINLSAAKIYFFNAGIWKQVGQGNTNHNDDILQPNACFIVRHNVSTNTVLTTAGRVITSLLASTLQTKTNMQQDNCIALQRPVPISLNDSGLISSGAFAASPLPGSRTDEMLTFDNSVAARNKSSSQAYYFWNGAWRQVGNGSTDVGTNLIFQPGTGVIIRKGTNSVSPVWTNAPTW
jgi:uncharacterized protein (TIGR02597 family)